MKKVILISTLSLLSIASAFSADIPVCRDALVNLVGESAESTKVNFTKILDGIDKNGKVCSMKISLYETTDSKNGLLSVQTGTMNPFNHLNVVKNTKGCEKDSQTVNGFSSFRQSSGWHHRFSTEVKISKSATTGKFTVLYAQEGTAVTCTGELK